MRVITMPWRSRRSCNCTHILEVYIYCYCTIERDFYGSSNLQFTKMDILLVSTLFMITYHLFNFFWLKKAIS